MRTLKQTGLALVALLGLSSCDGNAPLDEAIKDRTFVFTSKTEHIEDEKETAILLQLEKGDAETEFTVEYIMDEDRNIVLKTDEGKEFLSRSQIRPDSKGMISFHIGDTELSKGKHTLSLLIATEYWKQKLEVPVIIDYQPFEIRHTVSAAAEKSTELDLELARGDVDAEYTVHCEIAGPFGYSIDRKLVFPEDRKGTVSLPLVRPGEYELRFSIDDGRTRYSAKEDITEIIRDRYRTLELKLTEVPQGFYSIQIPENPYKVGLELHSRMTVKGSCDYDDVYSDRDGDWPWARTAYSEENADSELYKGYYSDELLECHEYVTVIGAIRDRTEQHCHFSECEGEFGYPSSCLTGYSTRHHEPYEELLQLDATVCEPVPGVTVKISHDIHQTVKKAAVLLNGKPMEFRKTYDCEVKKDEKQ